MRNLIAIALALLGAVAATEYNQYSHCREWRLELALREQGAVPERSWGAAAVDLVAGDLIAVGEKWRCGIAINRRAAVWAAVEAAAVVPVAGSAAAWTVRAVGRGASRLAAVLGDATALRGAIRGPMALVGKITARRASLLFVGGALLAVYFADGQLLLDALALLHWVVQWALWAILFFALAKCTGFALRIVIALRFGLRQLWRWLTAGPLLAEP